MLLPRPLGPKYRYVMSLVFLSYRRADTQDFAGRVYDKICSRYRPHDVFFDVNAIPFGVDFREYIEQEIEKAKVVIALLGSKWLGGDDAHNRMLEDIADYVRIEIEIALRQDKPVIPLLVGEAEMPRAEEIPESIHDFLYLNACTIDSGPNFHATMERLLDRIDLLVGEQPSEVVRARGSLEILPDPSFASSSNLTTERYSSVDHPDCEIYLSDNSVSRRHAKIEPAGEGYTIVDTNSSNGLYLNGTKVVRPRHSPMAT